MQVNLMKEVDLTKFGNIVAFKRRVLWCLEGLGEHLALNPPRGLIARCHPSISCRDVESHIWIHALKG